MISFPGQMEVSLSPVSKTNNNLNSPNIGTKIIDTTNSRKTLDVGSKKYLLSIGEKLCRTFGPAQCKFLPVLIKSWPDDQQDRHIC